MGASRARLLFRGSEHGFRMVDCHRCVDGQGPTLLLVRTTTGSMCGAYVGGSWASAGGDFCAGGHSFLFSLDRAGNGVPMGVAFTCHIRNLEIRKQLGCLSLGSDDLVISNLCHQNSQSRSNLGHSYGQAQGMQKGTHSLVQEGPNFTVAEYEVWALS